MIAVVRVDSIIGSTQLTNGHPPDVVVTVRDPIKGCLAGEALRVQGWVTGRPFPPELDDHGEYIRRWEASPTTPPAPGARLLLYLRRAEPDRLQQVPSNNGPVWLSDPSPQQVAVVRGTTWIKFRLDEQTGWQEPSRLFVISGTLENTSRDTMDFDQRNVHVLDVSMPTGLAPGDRWRAHPQLATRLRPGERLSYFFYIDWVSPVPIGYPGSYAFNLELPAEVWGPRKFWLGPPATNLPDEPLGQGNDIHVEFRVDGQPNLNLAAAAAWEVFTASVDSIAPGTVDSRHPYQVSLIDRRWLLNQHDDVVVFSDWPQSLPLEPVIGRRFIVFRNRNGQIFHVAAVSRLNLNIVESELRWVEENK